MITAYLMLGLNVLLLVSGQHLWKVGMLRRGGGGWPYVLRSPYIWAGLALYGAATLLWLDVLSRLPLAVAYPVQALAYALGMLGAKALLQEGPPTRAWVGSLLMLLGVGCIAYRPVL